VVKVHLGVAIDELYSDSQGLHVRKLVASLHVPVQRKYVTEKGTNTFQAFHMQTLLRKKSLQALVEKKSWCIPIIFPQCKCFPFFAVLGRDTLKQVETYDKINNIIIIFGEEKKVKGQKKDWMCRHRNLSESGE